jgi:chemotaxis methyl-accepting protein methylase
MAASDTLQVANEVQSRATFGRFNLRDDSKMLLVKGMDRIFCCHVLGYCDGSSKRRVLRHSFSGTASRQDIFPSVPRNPGAQPPVNSASCGTAYLHR